MPVRLRNKPHKWQLGSVFVIGVIISCLFNVVLTRSTNADSALEENICSTSTCRDEAAKIRERLNPKINPCENFYEFACGNAQTTNSQLNQYGIEKPDPKLLELYTEPIRDDDHVMVKAEKRVCQGIVNPKPEIPAVLAALTEALQTLGGWPIVEGPSWDETKFDWLQTTYKLREIGLPFGTFLDLTLGYDPRNNSRYVLQVVSVENSSFVDDRPIREKTFLADVQTFTPDSDWTTKDVINMYDFELKLKDLEKQQSTLHTVEEYQKKYDSINWLEFINTISGPRAQISLQDSVLFPDVETLRKKMDIIANTPKRVQANYLIWNAIHGFAKDLRSQEATHSHPVDYCVYAEYFMPRPIEVMFARKYISKNKKQSIEELVKNMKNELTKLVNQVEWITEEEKQTINEKLTTLKLFLGILGDYLDDKVLDDSNVNMEDVSNENFFTVLTQVEKNYKSLKYGNIHKTLPEVEFQKYIPWNLRPRDILFDAYSQFLGIPTLTTLPDRWFNDNRPEYLNYGVLGTAVGGKLGGNVIKEPFGSVHTPAAYKFSKESENLFSTIIKQCLYTDLQNHKLSNSSFEERSWSRMIVGSKLAYNAYREWVKNNNKEEQKLVDIDYTPNQLFWISSVDCIENPFNVKWFMTPIPKEYIPNLVVRNNAEFAQDFNCPVNSPMNPQERCFNI